MSKETWLIQFSDGSELKFEGSQGELVSFVERFESNKLLIVETEKQTSSNTSPFQEQIDHLHNELLDANKESDEWTRRHGIQGAIEKWCGMLYPSCYCNCDLCQCYGEGTCQNDDEDFDMGEI